MNIITKINNYKKSFVTLLAGLLAFSPTLSFAQQLSGQNIFGSIFTPVTGDKSVHMLGQLFGGLVGNGSADPLLDLITSFNSAILAIGAILIAYTIFAGTINTANEGKFLARFNGAWVPLRTAVAAALVIPVNGYCVMQYIVMWLVLQGVGLADTVWLSLVEGESLTSRAKETRLVGNSNITKMAKDIFISSACVIAGKKISQDIMGSNEEWGYKKDGNKIIFYGGIKDGTQANDCGKIVLVEKTVNNQKDIIPSHFATISKATTSDIELNIHEIHNQAVQEMLSGIYSLTNNYIEVIEVNGQKQINNNISKIPDNFLSKFASDYELKLTNALNNANSQLLENQQQELIAESRNFGWILAGAWFMKIANQMSVVREQIGNFPKTFTPIKKEVDAWDDTWMMIKNVRNWNGYKIESSIEKYKASEFNKALQLANLAIYKDKNVLNGDNDSDDGWWARLMSSLAEAFTGVDLKNSETGVHPIIQAKSMGDSLITGSLTAIASIVGVAALGGILSAGTLTSAVVVATPFAFTIFGGLLAMGWFLAYYIPMMPFLIWIGALLGWFIMVIEAIIAAPLWAVMHLHPNGDDVTGRGGQGYMLVLGLLVRPTLMIFGFAAAIILSMVFGDFLNMMFYEVFKLSRNGDSIGAIGVFLAYVIYVSMFVTFIKKMFDMIHIIPDQLLQWIGGGGPQLGGYAGAMVQGSENDFMKGGAAIGAISSRGIGDGVGAAQRGLTNARMKSQQEQQRRLAEEGKIHDMAMLNNQEASKMGDSGDDYSKALSNNNSSKFNPNSKEGQQSIAEAILGANRMTNQLKDRNANPEQIAKAQSAYMNALSNTNGSTNDKIKAAQNAGNAAYMSSKGFSEKESSLLGSISDKNSASAMVGEKKLDNLKSSVSPEVSENAVNSALGSTGYIYDELSNSINNGDVSNLTSEQGVNDFVNNALAKGGITGQQAQDIGSYQSLGEAKNHLMKAATDYQNSPTQSNQVSLNMAGREVAQRVTNSIFHHATQNSISKGSSANNGNQGSGGHSVSGSSQTTVSEVKDSGPPQSGGGSRINPSETDRT